MYERIVMHIDVNSAYLSWENAYRMQMGSTIDYREIPCIVGGNKETRRGIVLAKSIPAKDCGIKTGEVLWKAFQKCPNLEVLPTNSALYSKSSKAFNDILQEYTPHIQKFSIDESFAEFTGTSRLWGDPVKVAHEIRERMKMELGFTVSIGVSTNKLLAKVGSEMKKPDAVTTLFPDEMESKMWPLDVGDLFGCGPATKPKLNKIGIFTIGDLANYDPEFLVAKFGKYGQVLYEYANGIEDSLIKETRPKGRSMKGIGNSSTISADVDDRESALLHLLSLTENVAARLREANMQCKLVSVYIRSYDLKKMTHQRKLLCETDVTNDIFKEITSLFDEAWDRRPIRSLGVRVSELSDSEGGQLPLVEPEKKEKLRALDRTIDELRLRFDKGVIQRGSFANRQNFKPVRGTSSPGGSNSTLGSSFSL